jgi:undecaprenyl-diphosphatase
MPLVDVAVLALVRGLAEALGLSASGAEAAARVLLEPIRVGGAVEAALAFGAALAVAVAVRRRLLAMFGEVMRAITRPALFASAPGGRDALLLAVALAVSAATHAALRPSLAPWQASPAAAGVGLLITGIGLASTAIAPRGTADAPTIGGALLVGLAHGGAGFPGASRLAAALTLLLWLGVRPQRAVEFALVLTAVTLVAAATSSTFGATEGADFAPVAIGVTIAFASALLGAWVLRTLAMKKRLGVLTLCVVPVGLALLVYARALPSS